jgi:hypothetical protein
MRDCNRLVYVSLCFHGLCLGMNGLFPGMNDVFPGMNDIVQGVVGLLPDMGDMFLFLSLLLHLIIFRRRTDFKQSG